MSNMDKTKEAKHILSMLDGEVNHDEVNGRVGCLLIKGTVFDHVERNGFMVGVFDSEGHHFSQDHLKYMTSLDACQSLMLEGWEYSITRCYAGLFKARVLKHNYDPEFYRRAKTAPPAWLHAILQSYIYTWEQDDENT